MNRRNVRLITLAVALFTTFLGSPAFASSFPAKTETAERFAIRGHSWCFEGSDFGLIENIEIGLPEEFGVALEDDDSREMSRVIIHQRLGIDRIAIEPKTHPAAARIARRNISPPLLV